MVLCATRLSAATMNDGVVVSHLICVKLMWKHTEKTRNSGLVYSIDREKLHQLILQQEFIQNIASDEMFISGEMVIQITLAALQQKNDSVFLMKLFKLSLYSYNTAIHSNI